MGNHFHLLLRNPARIRDTGCVAGRASAFVAGGDCPGSEQSAGDTAEEQVGFHQPPLFRNLSRLFPAFTTSATNAGDSFGANATKASLSNRGTRCCIVWRISTSILSGRGWCKKPQDYGWCSLGYHKLQGNKGRSVVRAVRLRGLGKTTNSMNCSKNMKFFVAEAGALEAEYEKDCRSCCGWDKLQRGNHTGGSFS